MSSTSVVLHYYLKELRRVLHGPRPVLRFLFATSMHAVGHAAVALVASALAVSLAARWGLGAGASVAAAHPANPHRGDYPALDRAFFIAVLGLAVVAVKGASGVYATYVQVRVAGQVGCALRLHLLDSLLCHHRLRQARHDDHGSAAAPTARAVAALTERVHEVELGLARGLLGGVRAVAQLVPIACILAVLSIWMAGVAAVVLGAFGWALGRMRGGYRGARAGAARERERLLEAADDSVRHADLWVTYGAEGRARSTVRRLGDAIATESARLAAHAAALSGANEVLAATALVLAIGASRSGIIGPVIDGETALAFAVAFFLAYRPLRELSDARLALARAGGAYEHLKGVVSSRPEATAGGALRDSIDGPRRSWSLGVLEVRGLKLGRGRSSAVSMRLDPGSIAVVIGPTGVGKTTFLRTLLGLDPAVAGEVLFHGEPLGDAPAGPMARPFAWVPQDAPLLADTLAANVTLGAPDADPAEALARLGAAHLGASLADARLGAGGRALSGGERQWIALARAVATCQPVLLLDEPTSGLDPEAQRLVLDSIALLRGKRSVVIVTHRPEPLAIADTILRMHAGAIDRAA